MTRGCLACVLACVLAALLWLTFAAAALPVTAALLAVLVLMVAGFCYTFAIGTALVITATTVPLHFLLFGRIA